MTYEKLLAALLQIKNSQPALLEQSVRISLETGSWDVVFANVYGDDRLILLIDWADPEED